MEGGDYLKGVIISNIWFKRGQSFKGGRLFKEQNLQVQFANFIILTCHPICDSVMP